MEEMTQDYLDNCLSVSNRQWIVVVLMGVTMIEVKVVVVVVVWEM